MRLAVEATEPRELGGVPLPEEAVKAGERRELRSRRRRGADDVELGPESPVVEPTCRLHRDVGAFAVPLRPDE